MLHGPEATAASDMLDTVPGVQRHHVGLHGRPTSRPHPGRNLVSARARATQLAAARTLTSQAQARNNSNMLRGVSSALSDTPLKAPSLPLAFEISRALTFTLSGLLVPRDCPPRGRPSIRFIIPFNISDTVAGLFSFALRLTFLISPWAGPSRAPFLKCCISLSGHHVRRPNSKTVCIEVRVAAQHVSFRPSCCHAAASGTLGRARDLPLGPGRAAESPS